MSAKRYETVGRFWPHGNRERRRKCPKHGQKAPGIPPAQTPPNPSPRGGEKQPSVFFFCLLSSAPLPLGEGQRAKRAGWGLRYNSAGSNRYSTAPSHLPPGGST